MTRKPLNLPPGVVRAFVEDMKAFNVSTDENSLKLAMC